MEINAGQGDYEIKTGRLYRKYIRSMDVKIFMEIEKKKPPQNGMSCGGFGYIEKYVGRLLFLGVHLNPSVLCTAFIGII